MVLPAPVILSVDHSVTSGNASNVNIPVPPPETEIAACAAAVKKNTMARARLRTTPAQPENVWVGDIRPFLRHRTEQGQNDERNLIHCSSIIHSRGSERSRNDTGESGAPLRSNSQLEEAVRCRDGDRDGIAPARPRHECARDSHCADGIQDAVNKENVGRDVGQEMTAPVAVRAISIRG